MHYLVMLSVKEHASRLKKLTVKLELLVQQDIPRKNNKKNVLVQLMILELYSKLRLPLEFSTFYGTLTILIKTYQISMGSQLIAPGLKPTDG